jgi:hypothetical protein
MKSFLFTELLRRTENNVLQNGSISVLGRKVRDTTWPSPLERGSVEYWNVELSITTTSEVPIVLRLKIRVLWNSTLYLFVNSNRRFGGVCCLSLQGINTSSVLQYTESFRNTWDYFTVCSMHTENEKG